MFDIPFELLSLFIGVALVLPLFGFLTRSIIPISLFLFISGGLLISLYLGIDNITMGQLVDTSIYTGNSTQYTYTPDNYSFQQELKTFMVFLAVVMMLCGAMVEYNGRR